MITEIKYLLRFAGNLCKEPETKTTKHTNE